MIARKWVMKRNCSLAPRQLALALTILCAVSLLVAAGFAMRGFWVVLGFSLVEALAVGFSYLMYARHATDHERITLGDEGLLVELIESEQVTRYRLDPRKTRVEPPASGHPLVALKANGTTVEVGRFLAEWKRRELARELRAAIAAERQTGFQF